VQNHTVPNHTSVQNTKKDRIDHYFKIPLFSRVTAGAEEISHPKSAVLRAEDRAMLLEWLLY